MDRLEEIRQRTEAATDGPWERFDTPEYAEIHVLGGKEAGFLPVALADEAYNADFIAHSREDVPYLLSEVDRLEKGWQEALALANTNAKLFDEATARAEAAEADKDGRCVVLPCKVGDTVYILRGDAHNGYETAKKTHVEKVAGGFTIWMLNGNTMKMNDFYYLTRSEAEAALANIQQTNDQTVSKLASSKSVPSQFQV